MIDNLFFENIPLFGFFQVMGFLLSLVALFIYTYRNNLNYFNYVFFYFFLLFFGFIFGHIIYNINYSSTSSTINESSQSILGSYLFLVIIYIFFRIFKLSKQIKYLDVVFLCFPIFQIIGKIGCYFGGCCGCDFLLMSFLPLQLFEAILLILSYLTIIFYRSIVIQREGLIFLLFTFFYSIIRFISEFFRSEKATEIFFIRSPQIMSLFLMFLSLFLILSKYSIKLKKI